MKRIRLMQGSRWTKKPIQKWRGTTHRSMRCVQETAPSFLPKGKCKNCAWPPEDEKPPHAFVVDRNRVSWPIPTLEERRNCWWSEYLDLARFQHTGLAADIFATGLKPYGGLSRFAWGRIRLREGYNFGEQNVPICYLPDFWLTTCNPVEVKPSIHREAAKSYFLTASRPCVG